MGVVLVVDDDTVSQTRLRHVLVAAGHTTIEVNDGSNAITVLLRSVTPLTGTGSTGLQRDAHHIDAWNV
jgi:CheY-like chemotaxis protein